MSLSQTERDRRDAALQGIVEELELDVLCWPRPTTATKGRSAPSTTTSPIATATPSSRPAPSSSLLPLNLAMARRGAWDVPTRSARDLCTSFLSATASPARCVGSALSAWSRC